MNKENIRNILYAKYFKDVRNYLKAVGFEEVDSLSSLGIQALTDQIYELQKLMESEDYDRIIDICHNIKGILLNMGLSELAAEFDKLKKIRKDKLKRELEETLKLMLD